MSVERKREGEPMFPLRWGSNVNFTLNADGTWSGDPAALRVYLAAMPESDDVDLAVMGWLVLHAIGRAT